MNHLIDASQLTVDYIEKLMNLSNQILKQPKDFQDACKGKILSTLFYEASTRTRLSFESAMLSLGGSVIGFSSAENSSAAKGESVADTIRTVSCYADICAIRHSKEGAALVASKHSNIPVINAGDGGHQHPTQTLTDLLTIKEVKNTFENQTIGLCGDLKFGRTVHSLLKTLSQYKHNHYILVSPEELKVPEYIIEHLEKNNISYTETCNLSDSIHQMDILYMTRVQRERFFNEEDYIRLKDSYILNKKKLAIAKNSLMIMHPLPRVNEIAVEVDQDERAYYFKQVAYGKYARMALILDLLEVNR